MYKYKDGRIRHRHDSSRITASSPLPVRYRDIITSELLDTYFRRTSQQLKQVAIAEGLSGNIPHNATQYIII